MKKQILQTIRTHNLMEHEMHIVLGLSGGPDSVCLFDVLCQLAEDMNLKIYPVHVNHMFRPGDAEEDQKYVEELCRRKGIECRSFVVDCNRVARELGMTSEEAGRKVRYDAFRTVANEIFSRGAARERIAIAVAQNADDQCETVLFRMMRGTGVDGLAGIAYKRWDSDGNAVIRPLLDVCRADIDKYCEERGLNPRIDHTNKQEIYTRNKIRLSLIPYIKENFNENILETVNRLAASASQDREYMHMQAKKEYERALYISAEAEENSCEQRFSVEYLKGIHPAVRMRVYNMALKKAGLSENITAAHLDGIDRVLYSKSPSALYDLPEECRVWRQYDQLLVKKIDVNLQAEQYENVTVNKGKAAVDRKYMVRFSAKEFEKIHGEDGWQKIRIRNRQPGDFIYIALKDGIHKKKLQDMLVDMKIPRIRRDELMMVAIGSEILCILPNTSACLEKPRFTAFYRPVGTREEDIIYLDNL